MANISFSFFSADKKYTFTRDSLSSVSISALPAVSDFTGRPIAGDSSVSVPCRLRYDPEQPPYACRHWIQTLNDNADWYDHTALPTLLQDPNIRVSSHRDVFSLNDHFYVLCNAAVIRRVPIPDPPSHKLVYGVTSMDKLADYQYFQMHSDSTYAVPPHMLQTTGWRLYVNQNFFISPFGSDMLRPYDMSLFSVYSSTDTSLMLLMYSKRVVYLVNFVLSDLYAPSCSAVQRVCSVPQDVVRL